MAMVNVKYVAALDIGTTYSGYAYSPISNPQDVKLCDLTSSFRTPTSVLVNKGKFVAFGQTAEDKFEERLKKGDNSHIMFRRFKNDLQNEHTLNTKTTVKDISGQHSMSALDIYTMVVKYLKNHLMRSLNRNQNVYSENDVRFVLAVPANWNNRVKVFVREAAMQAGIAPERFVLALECEAASIWCQTVSLDDKGKTSLKKPGTKYVMVDLGGSNADIAIHKSMGDGSLESLHFPCGGDWGGTSFDTCFVQYVSLAFGPEVVKEFESNFVADYFKLMNDFESIKPAMKRPTDNSFSVNIPTSLINLAKQKSGLHGDGELRNQINSASKNIQLQGNKLWVGNELSNGMADYASRSVCFELSTVLEKKPIRNIENIVVVGGFAESELVQNIITAEMKGRNVYFPKESSYFVMKGSVLYGHNPSLIKTRVLQLTYGIKVAEPYDEVKHKDGDVDVINGKKMCTNVFRVLIKGGTTMEAGHQITLVDKPLTAEQTDQTFEIVSTGSTNDIPILTSHRTVNKEALFSVPLRDGKLVADKAFARCTIFGNTEIQFQITFKKGKKETYSHYLTFT